MFLHIIDTPETSFVPSWAILIPLLIVAALWIWACLSPAPEGSCDEFWEGPQLYDWEAEGIFREDGRDE